MSRRSCIGFARRQQAYWSARAASTEDRTQDGSAADRDPVTVPAHAKHNDQRCGRVPSVPANTPSTPPSGRGPEIDKVASSLESRDHARTKTDGLVAIRPYNPPAEPRKRIWDLFVLLLVAFSTLYESYNAAFRPMHTEILWWELVVDCKIPSVL